MNKKCFLCKAEIGEYERICSACLYAPEEPKAEIEEEEEERERPVKQCLTCQEDHDERGSFCLDCKNLMHRRERFQQEMNKSPQQREREKKLDEVLRAPARPVDQVTKDQIDYCLAVIAETEATIEEEGKREPKSKSDKLYIERLKLEVQGSTNQLNRHRNQDD